MLLAVIGIGLIAGVLGAILGLGGGVVVVPALEFILPKFAVKLDLSEAVAISQVGVLAVGIASTAGYIKRNVVRVRDGYLLAPLTIVGGVIGSVLGLVLPAKMVALVFSLLLLYSAYNLLKGLKKVEEARDPSPWVRPAMTFAGVMSGLLGIGGGTVQVPVMNLLYGMPIREAIATSTFIMGLTATANVVVYHSAGLLNVHLACAVALGILLGARLGASVQQRIPAQQLKLLFSLLLIFTALQFLNKYWF